MTELHYRLTTDYIMTLTKQLILIVTLVFAILFVGTMIVSISNMRTYLVQQLESHAQDTASSLGLSLTPHFRQKDNALMNSMIDAIFDRGYYHQIRLTEINGKPLIEKKSQVKIDTVPTWFIESIPLKTPEAMSVISYGWKQRGRVYVRSHPGYAYLELWRNTIETFNWFLITFSLAIVGFTFLVRYILKPLKLVEQQALSITRREFPVLNTIPKTRELKRVVIAMNKMSKKIKGILREQTDTIERVQQDAYVDKLTGVANRRGFDMQLEHTVNAKNEVKQAALLFVRIKGLIEINNAKGYQEGDAVIKQVIAVIKRSLENFSQAFIARTSGEQFAILLPNISYDDVDEVANDLAYQIPHANITQSETDLCHIGGAWYSNNNGKPEIKDLLSKADFALRSSLVETPNASRVTKLSETSQQENKGAQLWAKSLREGIEKQQFRFYQQPIVSLSTNEVIHNEIFTKMLSEDGELISGMHFVPMAEKMGLMSELDKAIVSNFIQQKKQKKNDTTQYFSVNISPSSFHDVEFVNWLYQTLKSEPEISRMLILETSEYVVSHKIEDFKKTVNDFHELGCRFSLDHFGTAFTPFGYLHDLNIDYIKVYGGLVNGVSSNKDNRFFIQSLCQIAHGLEIEVIGEFVEKEEDYIVLKQLGVNAVQGYYIGQIAEY